LRAKFRRQHSIGPFIADFCCVELRLIVEVDGGQHAERAREDERRTAYLESRGYRVVRFWNNEVLGETEAVMQRIYEEVAAARRRLEERRE
jgi:very-short-patch-repair endonuclease